MKHEKPKGSRNFFESNIEVYPFQDRRLPQDIPDSPLLILG